MAMSWEVSSHEHHLHCPCNLHKIGSEALARSSTGVRLWDLEVALMLHGWRLAHVWRPCLSSTEVAELLTSPDGLTK